MKGETIYPGESDARTQMSEKEIRQTLILSGPGSLSTEQLLALLLQQSGVNGQCLEVARGVMETFDGSLARMSSCGARKLRSVAGLGVRGAAVIDAALELGHRLAAERTAPPVKISSSDGVAELFKPSLAALKHEEFWVVYLSSANTVLDKVRVGQGGVSGVAADSRIIVKRALELLCSAIILVHNHPSGVARPSPEDIALTEKVTVASELFGIKVLDHIIISQSETFSFALHGVLTAGRISE